MGDSYLSINMIKALLVMSLLLFTGCSKAYDNRPSIMDHTHKVWYSADYMKWQNDDGFTCGEIERDNYGWLYKAKVWNWNFHDHQNGFEPWGDFNNFKDAVDFVEKWCKP